MLRISQTRPIRRHFVLLILEKANCQFQMPKLLITEVQVKAKLSKLKIDKSPGTDQIHPRVLKELHVQLCGPIAHLYNLSLKEGKLPDDWRESNITALHKKGSKASVNNYRPISLTSIMCKTLESVIRDHIMDHFIKNKLFSKKQFGFIKSRSTVLQLLNVLDLWTSSLEEGGYVDAIYTDFEKAFDKVPHNRLLAKLKTYGICDDIIAWIRDFLCNRRQRVKINGKFSSWHKVFSGIPQGSVLGPLLFVIYINDLVEECEGYADIFLFADDAKLFKHIKTVADHIILQQACDRLCNWADRWLLPLNASKCILLRIGNVGENNDDSYNIQVKNVVTNLKTVTSTKDLGVIVDENLNFKEHTNTKINKAYSMLGIINRNFKHTDKDTFVNLYKTIVRSHLDYAISVWAPHSQKLIDDLERVQRRATKLVKQCKDLCYQERLKYLQLPTLAYRRVRGDMIEVYKILTNKYDDEVNLNLGLSKNTCTRGNSLKLSTVRTKYDKRKYFFTIRVVSVWNSLPDSVVTAQSINAFKREIDKHWQHEDLLYNYRAKLSGTGVRGLEL